MKVFAKKDLTFLHKALNCLSAMNHGYPAFSVERNP